LYLVLKHGENGSGRVTVFKLCGKRMRKKVLLGLLLVCLQGSVENGLKVGGLGGRAGGLILGHREC
jgi:hypothetical protein